LQPFCYALDAITSGYSHRNLPVYENLTLSLGKPASGQRLERIKQSPNYVVNQFVNLSRTPNFASDVNMPMVLKAFFFEGSPNGKPKQCSK
jgi:hypothetical protein